MQKAVKKTSFDIAFTVAVFLLLLLAFLYIDRVSEGMRQALSLCAHILVPTLFPFLIFSDLLLSFGTAQRVLSSLAAPISFCLRISPGGGAVFLLGNLFGFPMGAKAAVRQYQNGFISREEAERLILCANNASPFFLIGSVGGALFHSLKSGVFLYLLQFLISFLLGCLLGLRAPKGGVEKRPLILPSKGFSLTATVQSATKQTIFICGYVLFFSVIAALFLPYLSNRYLAVAFAGILEISNGVTLAANTLPHETALAMCAFCASFSGLSVYFQTEDALTESDLRLKGYIPLKLLCGALSFFLALLFARLH